MAPQWAFVVLMISVLLAVPSVSPSSHSCPTWFYYSNATRSCECGLQYDWIICNPQTMEVQLMDGFCMTYSGQGGLFYTGICPFSYKFNHTNRLFSQLTTDPDLLNDTTCGPYNRKGLLCGECIDGYGLGVTLNDGCTDCSRLSTGSAVCLYLLLEFVPIITFFLFVVILHLNLTGGPMIGYLLFCQGLSFLIEVYQPVNDVPPISHELEAVFQGIIEFWSLNFFTTFIPPFCISDRLTQLHITLLKSLSTLCLVSLVFSYIVIVDLHSRSCKAIKILTKPLIVCLKMLNCNRKVTSISVIRTFSTFLFLSSTKIFKTSCIMMLYTPVFSNTGGFTNQLVCSGTSIKYVSYTHVIFLVLAIIQCLLFVLFPLSLLILYPTRIYRYLSRFISARKQLAITAFVEALNGGFKDGLNGTTDYRSLAGVIMFGIPLLTVVWLFITIQLPSPMATSLFITVSLYVSYSRPFKSTIANMSLSFYFILFWAFQWGLYLWINDMGTSTETVRRVLGLILVTSQLPVSVWALYLLVRYILKKASGRE